MSRREVESGHAHGEPELIADHASVAHTAMVSGDQPGDGPFHHGPPLPVDPGELTRPPGLAGPQPFFLVGSDADDSADARRRAPAPQRAAPAAMAKNCRALWLDRHSTGCRAGDSASRVVDGEVVPGEAAGNSAADRHRLDRLVDSPPGGQRAPARYRPGRTGRATPTRGSLVSSCRAVPTLLTVPLRSTLKGCPI